MIPEDPNRKKRVHVVGVRVHKDRWMIVLSDDSTVAWDVWSNMSREERWNQ